jgi:PIN domain nuclease of toxin-antitoxin system
MTLVLDTHAWVWWIGGPACPRLPARVQRAIDGARRIGVSAMSCLEVAWLVAHGRLGFDRPTLQWIEQALARPRVELLPLSPSIATSAAELPWENKDPADRVIVATAIEHRAKLVTRDEPMRKLTGVTTLW